MFGQQRTNNQQSLTEEGIIELSDEQLEGISGGAMTEEMQYATEKYRYGWNLLARYSLENQYKRRLEGVPVIVPSRPDPRG